VLLHDSLHTTAASAALGYAAFSLAMTSMRFAGDRLVIEGVRRLLRSQRVAALALAVALWVWACWPHDGGVHPDRPWHGTVAPSSSEQQPATRVMARDTERSNGHSGLWRFLVVRRRGLACTKRAAVPAALSVLAILAPPLRAAHHVREPVPQGV